MINRLRENFTMVDNNVLSNNAISLKAKGLYAFLCSKPDSWNFSYAGLTSQLKEGEKSIRTVVKELVDLQVLLRISKKKGGEFQGWEWIINPTAEDLNNNIDPLQNGQNRKCLKPEVPETGSSGNGNEISNTNLSNNILSNTIIPEDKSSAVVQKHIQVVNMLILIKQMTIGNQKEYSSTIRRNSKCAKRMLDTYSLEDIAKALIFCFKSDFPTWGLEAAEKNIQEVKYRETTQDTKKAIQRLLEKSANYSIN